MVRSHRVVRWYLLAGLLMLALQGCDLFTTRTPETPDVSTAFIWTPATTLDYVVQNFKGTVQVVDVSNHVRLFVGVDSITSGATAAYQFIPRAGLDAQSLALFQQWNVESERAYLTKLRTVLPKNPRLTVEIANVTQVLNLNSATLSAEYHVTLPLDASSTIPSTIAGLLQFQLVLVTTEQGTKEWRIQTWSDSPLANGSSQATWTDLKLKLSL